MTSLLVKSVQTPLPINLSALIPLAKMSDRQFDNFCRTNPDLHIEQNANGEVIVMPPAFADMGNRNGRILRLDLSDHHDLVVSNKSSLSRSSSSFRALSIRA